MVIIKNFVLSIYNIFIILILLIASCQNKAEKKAVILVTAFSNNIANALLYDGKIIDLGNIVDDTNKTKKIELSTAHPFGLTISLNSKDCKYAHISLKTNATEPVLNLACETQWGKWLGSNCQFYKQQNGWSEMHLVVKIPDTLSNQTLKCYASFYGKNPILVDSLHVELFDDSPFQNEIPDYVFQPLVYELVHQLSIQDIDFSKTDFIQKATKLPISIFDYFGVDKFVFAKIAKEKGAKLFEENFEFAAQFKTQNVSFEKKPSFENELSGFSKKIIYNRGEIIPLDILNSNKLLSIKLLKPIANYQFQVISNLPADTKSIHTKDFKTGVYCVQLESKNHIIFNIPIIINEPTLQKIIVLAPITTWHAYNYFGGKSFYDNTKDANCVYQISTNRPLVSCVFDSTYVGHDLFVFENILQFFQRNYGCNVYPDYFLEQYPELFNNAKTIVFAQHCEYFSTKMYNNTNLLKQTKNIISLGGNQAYWQVKFSNDFSQIECHKDGTYYDNSIIHGGMFRSLLNSESLLWGVAYTELSYGTYNSYKAISVNHWIFDGTNCKEGDEFGKAGIDGRGICGDELDFINEFSPKNTKLLAKGTNNNNQGGDFVIVEGENNAILSTGSIASGSGLGTDIIFTKMISNFMKKYN